ncbi:SseB family protein [Actinomadura sp. NPDC023710]|uniref:SseB family protein n=1 Tax=Actinomadura sp. NPDC023710 TaxID=3158219 RepID=UPI0033DA2620
MDWNDFAKRLTLELSRLPVTSFLIVQGPSGLPYVQAMRSEGTLDAEAVGSAFLPRPLASRQERRLRALGWEPPDEEDRKNWWDRLTFRERGGRASSELLEACALLAGQMMGAFRDVYGIESPLELVYQASKAGPDGGPLALPGLGIALAVPEDERPARASARPARPSGSTLEAALAEARERGDQHGYLELLARATLYLPSPGDPEGGDHQFATAQFGDGTFVLAFTSPEAMDRSLQGQAIHHRRASLAELSRRWPHPEWQLAVNPGLPSACYLDANALLEPEEPRTPTPPVPTDVHVAGPSTRRPASRGSASRTGGRGAPRGGRQAPRPPQRPEPARPRTETPSAPSAPSHASTAPPDGPPAPGARAPAQRRPAPPPPPQAPPPPAPAPSPPRSPEVPVAGQAPATRETPIPRESPVAKEPSVARETPVDPQGLPARKPAVPPTPSRETPSDPHGLPVAPIYGRRERARADTGQPRTEPRRPGTDTRKPSVPAAAAKPSPADTQTRAERTPSIVERGARAPSGARGVAPQGPADASQVVVMQKAVRPEHVQHYLEGGYDLVAGYVHRLQDVQELRSPGALIRALGLVYEGSPFAPADEQIFVIRWPAVKPALFRRPLGGIDEWSMGIIPGGWVIEKAPFPGSGYAPGDGPAIPEFKVQSQRLPHGAEMYRLDAQGRESLVAGYDADLRRWLVKLPGGQG